MTVQCGELGCLCACHRAKRRQVPHVWTPSMEAVVTTGVARGETVCQIAARLHLSEESIHWRMRRLGLSRRDGWRSRQEITETLGVSWRAMRRWMRDGLLRVTRHGTRWTRVADADLEAFVRAHAGLLFEPSDVTDARLRRLAETSAVVNRRRAG